MNEQTIPVSVGSSPRAEHTLVAADRREISVRGVREVLSFDENNVRLVTSSGILNLEGRELRIHALDTKAGAVSVTGILDGVLYEELDDRATDGEASSSKRTDNRRRGLFR